jgi:hypothetical protein
MRLTRLDDCCKPLAAAAPCAFLVTKGFVSVAYSPEISEAEEIELKNANGDVCVSDPGCDVLKWVNTTLSLCNVDPDVLSFITGAPLVLDSAGNSVGNRIQTGAACKVNFALEVWTDIPGQDCAAGAKQYGYFLAPCIGGGILGDWTVENDALNLELNAKARSGSGWGSGPWDVDETAIPPAVSVPGPLLTPIGVTDVMDLHLTTIAPPDVTEGCQAMPAA